MMTFPKAHLFVLLVLSLAVAGGQTGPTFSVKDDQIRLPIGFVVYGDQRFTDPANVTATDPRVRKYLVERIAAEKPAEIR